MSTPSPRPLPAPGSTARRAARVAAVLSRHGLPLPVRAPAPSRRSPLALAGRRLAAAFEELGPTFIKLGQLVASAPGIFPDALARELARCRDRVAPLPAEAIVATIEASLGWAVEDLFPHFEREPLSSASIAQVHGARLPSGERVVVKVTRPGIEKVVSTDLAMLERSASLLERLLPAAGATVVEIVAEFRRTITEELDFEVEAAYQRRMGEILRTCGSGEVVVPALVDDLCSRDVLTMERLDGFFLDDAEAMRRSGLDPVNLLHHAIRTVQETAIVHGVFHGDQHSANLLVLSDGRLAYIDFGIMGRLERPAALALGRFFGGMLFEDYPFVVDSLVALGALPADIERARLVRDVRAGASKIFARGVTGWELGPMIRLGLRLAVRYRARVPRGVVLLAKQLLYLDGVARALAPDADLMAEAVEILLYFANRYPDLTEEILPDAVREELRDGGPDAVRAMRAGAAR